MASQDHSEPVDLVGPYPTHNVGEAATTAAAAAVSGFPVVGGPAAALIEATLSRRIKEDQAAWLNRVAELLNWAVGVLSELSIEDLIDDETFRSVFASAYQAATRTGYAAKLDALANAVVNSVGPHAPEAHYRFMFLQFIDDLQPAHLRLLAYCADPIGWYDRAGIPREHFLSAARLAPLKGAFPEWSEEFIKLVAGDLTTRNLIDGATLYGSGTENSVWAPIIHSLGAQFLEFIHAPPELGEDAHAP